MVVPDEEGWLSINLDTGAAASVWPAEANYGPMLPMPENVPTFKTATGECVRVVWRMTVNAEGEWGQRLGMEGWLAPVRKPLMSAGQGRRSAA